MTAGELGSRLRELRERAGLSRPALALASGVNERRLRDAERGVHELGSLALFDLAEALGVRLDEFRRPAADPSPRPRGRPRKAPPA